MSSYLIAALVTCACWLGSRTTSNASPAEAGAAPIIALRGQVESKKVVGSLKPGEASKEKIVIYVLKLPTALSARGLALAAESGDPGKGFQELQLVCDRPDYPECESTVQKAIGREVRVAGQTGRSESDAEHTAVIVHVRLITVLK